MWKLTKMFEKSERTVKIIGKRWKIDENCQKKVNNWLKFSNNTKLAKTFEKIFKNGKNYQHVWKIDECFTNVKQW